MPRWRKKAKRSGKGLQNSFFFLPSLPFAPTRTRAADDENSLVSVSSTSPLRLTDSPRLPPPLSPASKKPTTTTARRASSVSTAALPLHLSDLFTLFNIEPAVSASLNAAAASVATSAGDAADAAVAVAVSSSSNNGGWLAPFAKGFEAFLKLLDGGLEAAHVPYSYGFSIILLTFLVKAATYPLTRKQMASTISLQALQPRVKEIQDRYKGRPAEEMQVEVARLYKEVRGGGGGGG